MTRTAASLFLALLVTAGNTSCLLGRRDDPTRFYVLTATAPAPRPAPHGIAVGLGPIALPGYLQRPTLATRDGEQVRYAEFDRWAEPLPALFARVLGQDLAAALGDARIVPFPWYAATALDVVTRVDVEAFEADVAGTARLDACWTIRRTRDAEVSPHVDCASLVETVQGDGPPGQVAALSRTVAALAQRMASAVGR